MNDAGWERPFVASWYWTRVARETGHEVGRLKGVLAGGSISRSLGTDTFESATVNYEGSLDVGCDLVRCHLVADFGDGKTSDVVLGTFAVSTPSRDVRGTCSSGTANLSGRLAELGEARFLDTQVIPRGSGAVAGAARICEDAGLEVVVDSSDYALSQDWVVGAEGSFAGGPSDETRLSAVNELLSLAGFSNARTDEYGRIVMSGYTEPSRRAASWTFAEGAGATFLTQATDARDLSEVANAVKVVFANQEACVVGIARDTDPSSPTSIPSLGWERCARYEYDDMVTQEEADARAAELLRTERSSERRVTITHAFLPLACGDAVDVSWPSAGIVGRFEVFSQEVSLDAGGCVIKPSFDPMRGGSNALPFA